MVVSNIFFSPLPGEMIQFDEHIFQMGWFNHQLVMLSVVREIKLHLGRVFLACEQIHEVKGHTSGLPKSSLVLVFIKKMLLDPATFAAQSGRYLGCFFQIYLDNSKKVIDSNSDTLF